MIDSEYGYIRLAVAIIEKTVEDYKFLLKRVKKPLLMNERRRIEYDIKEIEHFFKVSPITGILPIAPEDMIMSIRKQINLESEEERKDS